MDSYTVTISKNNSGSASDPKAILWTLIVLFVIGGSIIQACS